MFLICGHLGLFNLLVYIRHFNIYDALDFRSCFKAILELRFFHYLVPIIAMLIVIVYQQFDICTRLPYC
jgi:hypothetical protein